MTKLDFRCRYIHSDVDTLERVEILRQLRLGMFDVLIGINLLREGLDLPEVSLVAIMDADKEGFLRSSVSLTQTVGRAARNVNGRAIMYADKITDSMQNTIDETNRRREKQVEYNQEHGITPTQVKKDRNKIMMQTTVAGDRSRETLNQQTQQEEKMSVSVAAEERLAYAGKDDLKQMIAQTKTMMEKAAKELDFIEAARLRDEMFELQKLLKSK